MLPRLSFRLRPLARSLRPCLMLLALLAAGCAAPPRPVATLPVAEPSGPILLAVAKRGWHTEIGIPEEALNGNLTDFGPAKLHRHYLLVGFGAKQYFTDSHHGVGEAAIALTPGRSAVNLTALDNMQDDPKRQIVWLHVSQANINALEAFIWWSITPQNGAAPQLILELNNASMFYEGRQPYSLGYNCNDWAVEALREAGLPFNGSVLTSSGDVLAQARKIAATQGGH